jgi:DNA modification methylase
MRGIAGCSIDFIAGRGNMVLNQFRRGGTVAIATDLRGRRCVCCEIDADLLQVAIRRLDRL